MNRRIMNRRSEYKQSAFSSQKSAKYKYKVGGNRYEVRGKYNCQLPVYRLPIKNKFSKSLIYNIWLLAVLLTTDG